ncbi:MAG: transcription elongation factor GreA [Alphaproteobacteria bacterium]|jgi:transcription elongation factor GreA|tara:strand:+ start:1474 stop:1947 length:474 start_codon:yes stop_codon:yes gene_type:complete
MDKIPMTEDGQKKLIEELKTLKTVERPLIVKAIADARSNGDLSENAEYHAAREKQSFIEGRIAEIEDIISKAEVIDLTLLSGSIIKFGASVTIINLEDKKESKYQLVGEVEADIESKRISVTSPLARALIGKKKGDYIEVSTPKGVTSYEIKSVRFK